MARNTQQRAAIRHVIEEAGRPMSVEEIFEAARESVNGLGIATVYRNLRTMVKKGVIACVQLPGETTRYEMADKGHHHHFVCDVCERVFEVPVCASDLRKMTPRGFSLERHEFVLYGRCVDCRR